MTSARMEPKTGSTEVFEKSFLEKVTRTLSAKKEEER